MHRLTRSIGKTAIPIPRFATERASANPLAIIPAQATVRRCRARGPRLVSLTERVCVASRSVFCHRRAAAARGKDVRFRLGANVARSVVGSATGGTPGLIPAS